MERIKIKNPQTGKWIYKDGLTAMALEKQGVRLQGPTKKATPFKAPTNAKGKMPTKSFPVDKSDVSWTAKAPEKTSQRRALQKTCGDSCFMMPKQLKFPVCNKDAPPCTYNQRGITAAYVRARQWGYEDVARKVEALRKKLSLPTAKK
jgi:hypothetical protein